MKRSELKIIGSLENTHLVIGYEENQKTFEDIKNFMIAHDILSINCQIVPKNFNLDEK